jgi:hypothetical protein
MMTDDISTKAFEKIGGLPALVKWIKESARNRSAFYSWYIPSRLRQPLVQTNVNVAVINEEVARAKLQDALLRQIEARKFDSVDPAVFVNGQRIIDGVSYTPASPDPAPSTDATRPAAIDDVETSRGARPATAAPRPVQSLVPGQGAGAALDEGTDNRSTTERFLSWSGHGRPP